MKNKAFMVELTTKQVTVTGSENLLRFKDKFNQESLVLVDCGVLQENNSNTFSKENVDFDLQGLRAVFITHAHNDHLGKLPVLVKEGYNRKIYLSKETALFIGNVLNDNLKIHREEAKKLNKKPLYDEGEIQKVINLLEPIEYKKSYKLNFDGVNVEFAFYRNNHILGSSSIYVRVKKGIENLSFLFSGDWNNKCNLLRKENNLMKEVLRSKNINLILESTYGSNINKIEEPSFERILIEEMKKGKKIFVAVNSLHKSSEVLSRIKDLQEQNENLFKDYSIYLDGKLTNKLNNIYMGILKKNFMPLGIKSILEKSERFEAMEVTKTIIVSSSGMMTNGPIRRYLSEFIEDENSSFIICSYCAEGTVGRYLVEKFKRREKKVELFGKKFKLKASILQAKNISSHGTGGEMIEEIIKKIPKENISSILLNHGEDEIREKFKKMIIFKTGLSEEKIFLYDSKRKFIFDKNGLRKTILLSDFDEITKETKEKKRKVSNFRVLHRRK